MAVMCVPVYAIEVKTLIRHVGRLFLLLCFCMSVPVLGRNQETSTTFKGVVNTTQNAVLPKALITVRYPATNQVKTVETDENGAFTFIGLPIGEIEVTVELSGFAPLIVSGLKLNSGTLEIKLTLDVEKFAGEKNVVTDPQSSTSVKIVPSIDAGVINLGAEVTNLPVLNRSFANLSIIMLGDAHISEYKGGYSSLVRNGGSTILLDGVDINNSQNDTVTMNIAFDSNEFIVSQDFTAEEGYSESNNINAIAKRGTNEPHGSIGFQFRDDALQAKGPFGGPSKPSFDRERIGGTLGGPIKRDKAFFFFALEHLRENGATTAGQRDLTSKQIIQTFAKTPFNNTQLTAKVDVNVLGDSISGNYYLLKVHGVTTGISQGGKLQDPNNFQTESNSSHIFILNWHHVFNSNLVNDLRFGLLDFNKAFLPRSFTPQIVFPSINVGANFRTGLSQNQRVPYLKENVTWVRGNQLFKFGAAFKHTSLETGRFDLFGEGIIFASCDFAGEPGCPAARSDAEIPVLLALINQHKLTGDFTDLGKNSLIPSISNNRAALFLQDDITVGSSLSLNLGLRWDYDTDINGKSQTNQVRPGKRTTKKGNLGPRFGIAWRLGRGVIRGGHGLYFNESDLETRQLELLADGIRQPIIRSFGGTLSSPFSHVLTGNPPDIFVTNNNFRQPYMHRFSVEGQFEITNSLVLSSAYNGERGRHFERKVEINLQPDGSRINTAFGSVLETQSIAKTSYDALSLSVIKRYSQSYGFTSSYILSRSNDEDNAPRNLFTNVSDPSNPALDRGPAPYDARHRFNFSGYVNLPWKITISALVNAASSLPFEIIQNHDFSEGQRTNFYRLPVLSRNAGGREVRTGVDVNRAIDLFNANQSLVRAHGGPLAHVNPEADLTNPYFSIDVGVSKIIQLSENARLQLNGDILNLTNHVNIRGVSAMNSSGLQNNVESSNFGKPLGVLRGGVFGTGGPRSVQFSLKFSF